MDDPLIVATRFGLYVALGVVFGLPLFALYGAEAASHRTLRLRPIVSGGAVVGLIVSLIGLALLTAGLAGKPLAALAREDFGAALGMPGFGAAWIVRVIALALLALTVPFLKPGRFALLLSVFCGGVALASLAWAGHAAATEGRIGDLHLASDIIHLLAAGAWVGALVGLNLLVAAPVERVPRTHWVATHRALRGFALAGTILVGTIVVTGLVHTWILVGPGRVLHLPETLWGRLLLVKLAFFTGMLGLAALNRYRFTPALEDHLDDPGRVVSSLRRSMGIEVVTAGAILLVVSWLGTLPPPASM